MKLAFLMAIPIVLALGFASAVAQNAALPQEKCAIEGTVVDAVTGQPLRGADVRLRSFAAGASVPGSPSAAQSTSATTDASGRFVFDGLPAGRFRLLASHDGYLDDNRGMPGLRGKLLTVVPGQHVNDVVIRLVPNGSIAGHITNEAGKPLRGVSVQAMKSSYPRGRRELRDVAHAATDQAGEYRLPGLAPGKYYIRAKPPHSLKAKLGSDKAYVPLYYPAVSDQARSVALVLRAGEDLAGIDMNFVPVHTVHIRGRVVDALTALPSKEAEVTLLSDQGETTFSSQNLSAGTFDFQGVPPGPYVLLAQEPSTPKEPKTMWGRTAIEVGDADLDHADVVVSPGVDVSGRIRVDGKTATDISNMTGILDLQEGSSLASLTPDIDTASVKADGSFLFREVPEGSYGIEFHPVPAGFYLKSSGVADVLEAGITVSRGHSPATLELVLSPGAGRIDGSVEIDEQAVPGASVVLVPDGKRRAQPNYYRQAMTDQLGRFAMRNVAPGDYTLFAWEQIERGAYMDPDFLGQYEDQGKAVHVEEGGQLSVQLDVIPAAETVP
jgi:protocatechuate 3,4-dioxygenase beta subunit